MMKIRTNISSTLLILIVAVALMPSVLSAKEREEKREREDRRNDRTEEKEEKKEEKSLNKIIKKQIKNDLKDIRVSCAPFGHFIAPGWIWRNGSTSPSDDCWLPRGIQKKWF